MSDVVTDYKVRVGAEISPEWKAYVKSVGEMAALQGGAMKATVEAAQKSAAATKDSVDKQQKYLTDLRLRSTQLADKQAAAEAKAAQRAADAEIKAAQKAASAQEKLTAKQIAEKEKAEKKAEALAMKAAVAAEKAAQKAADAEIKAAQKAAAQIEKEEEKKQAYLLKLRLKSIQDANKAEEKARRDAEKSNAPKEKSGGGVAAGLAGGIGFGTAIAGFKALQEHAEAADKANDSLHMGIAATGLAGKQLADEEKIQSENAKKFTNDYKGISEEAAKSTIATIAEMSHKKGDELKQLSEDAIILAHGDAEKAEAIGKMLGKATNEEVEANATKLGISLDKNMNAEQRAAKIHEEAMKRKKAVQDADNDSLGTLTQIMNKVMTTVTTFASTILDALKPALDAVVPLVDQVGTLLGQVLEPILKAIVPVVTIIGKAFSELAPVIVELVTSALELLTPILSEVTGILEQIIPVITDVVKTVLSALMPVFKALAPIIQELSQIFLKMFSAELMGVIVPIIKDVFVPLLTDLVVPILLALLPLIKQMADLFMKLVVPAIQGVSSIMKWLIDNAIQPLVKWLSGTLVEAIKAVIGVAEEVIGAISSIASAVGGILGLGDDEPKKAVKKQSDAVAEEQKAGEQKRTDVIDKAEEARRKKAEADAKKNAGAAGKAVKTKYEAEKDAIENAFIEQKALIDTANSNGKITDAEAKRQLLQQQLIHDQKMLDLAVKFHQKTTQLKAQVAKTESDIRKNDQAQLLSDAKSDSDELLAELEIRGMKENLTVKQIEEERFQIERTALVNELYLREKSGEDISKLKQQLTAMDLKHSLAARKEQLALVSETNKLTLENQKEFLNQQIQQLKILGKDTSVIENQLAREEAREEEARYAEELAKRKEQGQAFVDENGRLNALGEQLELQHQNKLSAIRNKAYEADKEKLANKFSFLVKGYEGLTSHIDNKFFKPMADRWFGQNEIAKSVFSELTGEAIKWLTKIVIQQGLALAEQLGFIAASTAATTAAGATAAATWGPAAIAASIATLGGADAAGLAAYTAAQAAGSAATLIPHAEGGVGVSPVTMGRHQFFEDGPEAVIPLSSGRAQGMMQTAFGFDKALAPVIDRLTAIEGHTAKTRTVLPMNNAFETARNNYLKSEDRRSL